MARKAIFLWWLTDTNFGSLTHCQIKKINMTESHYRLSHVMSNTVDMTQVGKYFSQHVLADKLSFRRGEVSDSSSNFIHP